jgi:Uri superfamily endonuclease
MSHVQVYDPAEVDAVPRAGGAYAVVLVLDAPTRVPAPAPGHDVPPGVYVYLGAAYGPGGPRARVTRHVRGAARRHWHLDHLRPAGVVHGAAVWPAGDECAWTAAIGAALDVDVPVPRFGSSDCRRCPAHLLRLPAIAQPVARVAQLGAAARTPQISP